MTCCDFFFKGMNKSVFTLYRALVQVTEYFLKSIFVNLLANNDIRNSLKSDNNTFCTEL